MGLRVVLKKKLPLLSPVNINADAENLYINPLIANAGI